MGMISVTLPERDSFPAKEGFLYITITAGEGEPILTAGKGALDTIRQIEKHGGCHEHQVTFSTEAWCVFQTWITEIISATRVHIKRISEFLES